MAESRRTWRHRYRCEAECKYENSRFDFYLEYAGRKAFMEVKGVTLEEDGVAVFRTRPPSGA